MHSILPLGGADRSAGLVRPSSVGRSPSLRGFLFISTSAWDWPGRLSGRQLLPATLQICVASDDPQPSDLLPRLFTAQKLGQWQAIPTVMRYAHHHPESLCAGIEILDRIPAGGSTIGSSRCGRVRERTRCKLLREKREGWLRGLAIYVQNSSLF